MIDPKGIRIESRKRIKKRMTISIAISSIRKIRKLVATLEGKNSRPKTESKRQKKIFNPLLKNKKSLLKVPKNPKIKMIRT